MKEVRFTLYGEAEGVLGSAKETHWATVAQGVVTDASVSARTQGVLPGISAKAAKALVPGIVLEDEPDEPTSVMRAVWERLWASSPWLETVGERAFLLQIPGRTPPLREVRNLLLSLEEQLSEEQRIRAGLAENPFLARALVEWSRVERVPAALYYKVGRQQWLLSPSLAAWLQKGGPYAPVGTWVHNLPLTALWTLPSESKDRLLKLGVSRLGQLEQIPKPHLFRHFGKEVLLWLRMLDQEPGGTVRVNYPPLQRKKVWIAPLGEQVEVAHMEELLQSLTGELAVELQQAACGALNVRMDWESDVAEGSFERVTKKPAYTAEALQAALWPGLDAFRGSALRRLEVSVADIRPLQSVQSSFAIKNGAFVPSEEVSRNDLSRLLYHVNRKFPKGLQVGLRPTFRELRLNAVLQDVHRGG